MRKGEKEFPMFLMKLWKLVEDPQTDDLISWSDHNGSCTFTIRNQVSFAKDILPLYFKHNNMTSFIRQLNMYGFRKVSSIDQGALKAEKDEIEFYHMYFARGDKDLLQLIKRKVTSGKTTEEVKPTPESLVNIISDVSALYSKQETVNNQLSNMKRENEALWREVASLRQQHMKQQQIVNKMIQFLLNLVRPNRGLGTGKRKLPLMLDEAPHNDSNVTRLARSFSYDNSTNDRKKVSTSTYAKPSSSGPVIHDITDAFEARAFEEPTSTQSRQPVDENFQPNVKSPETLEEVVASTIENNSPDPVFAEFNLASKPDVLEELLSVLNTPDFQQTENLALPSAFDTDNRLLEKISNQIDLNDHVGTAQLELDHLKEMLSNSGCTLDFSSMLGCFLPDSVLQRPGGSDMEELNKISGNEIVGNELIQYNPSIMEFVNNDIPSFSEDLLPDHSEEIINGRLFENLIEDEDETLIRDTDTGNSSGNVVNGL